MNSSQVYGSRSPGPGSTRDIGKRKEKFLFSCGELPKFYYYI